MTRLPPISTRTDTLVPYTTLCRSALRAGHVDAVPVRGRRSHRQFLEAPLEGLHDPHDRQNPGKRVQAGNPLRVEVPLAEAVQFEKSGKSRREGQKGIAGGHVRAAQEGEDAFGRLLADDADAVDLEKGK